MNTTRLKKLLILNTPYVVIGLYATKLGEAWRLAEGTDASNNFLHLMDGLSAAFRSPFPSLYPADLLIGIVVGCLLRLAVYEKGRNAKKYRHNVEYGSARWGTHSDIAPFIDPDPWNNVILTKTESLTMNSRPKAPRNARNRNVLVVGGSGSGKTRFFIKPNIMSWTKEVTAKYSVIDLLGDQRASLNSELTAYLKDKFEPYGIIIESVSLINIDPDDETRAAVQKKVNAQQDLELAKIEQQTVNVNAEKEKEVAITKANQE